MMVHKLPNVPAFSGEARSGLSILPGGSERRDLQTFRAERRGLRPSATPGWAAYGLIRQCNRVHPDPGADAHNVRCT